MVKVYSLVEEIISKSLLQHELKRKPDRNSCLVEYGLDSLTSIAVISKIEETFNIELLFEDLAIEKIDTIDKIVYLLINNYKVNIDK
jgi:acyl carrier protein